MKMIKVSEIDPYRELEQQDNNTKSKGIFIPTKENKPPNLKPILTINGEQILTHQNVTTIIAPPGSGKSSVCEAICSSIINPDCDSFGIKVSDEVQKVLFIDTERSNLDVWNSFDRMNRRAGREDSEKAVIVGMRDTPRLKQRKEQIENVIQNYKPQLLILDGAGDMVTDTNSLEQAIECRIWFRELTCKYELSILTTLHPNKGTKNPRGHIGSEMLRESEGVFLIDTDGEVKTLTDDFEHGKNRNGSKISTSFTWDKSNNMFKSCVGVENTIKKVDAHKTIKIEKIKDIVKELTEKNPTATDFRTALIVCLKQDYPRAKTGNAAINEFIVWLERNKFITIQGTNAKKVVKMYVEESDELDD